MTDAGVRVAARRAAARSTPASTAVRTALSMVSVLPARTDGSSARAARPSDTRTSRAPSRCGPSPAPVAGIASVTSTGRADSLKTSLITDGWTWCPSATSSTETSFLVRAAPTGPGARCPRGGIALKRWATWRAPREKAREACPKSASVCPIATTMPRAQPGDERAGPRQLGGERDERDRAGGLAEQRLQLAGVDALTAAGSCAPGRLGEIQGPSRWTPITRAPSSGPSRTA